MLQGCCHLRHHHNHHLRNCQCGMEIESSFLINFHKFWPYIQIHSCQCRFLWDAINSRSNAAAAWNWSFDPSPPSSREFKNSWSYISIIS